MEPFAYRAHTLACEGVSARALTDAAGDRFTIGRRRETYEDLVEGETTV